MTTKFLTPADAVALHRLLALLEEQAEANGTAADLHTVRACRGMLDAVGLPDDHPTRRTAADLLRNEVASQLWAEGTAAAEDNWQEGHCDPDAKPDAATVLYAATDAAAWHGAAVGRCLLDLYHAAK